MVSVKQNPSEVDEGAARELYLYATNDTNLYRQQITPINKNLITKKARGIYKTELAVKLAMYLMENAAKKYAREFGGTWNEMFNVPTRREAAKEFVEHFENEAGYGNYDNLLPAKYQKKNPTIKGDNTIEHYRELLDELKYSPESNVLKGDIKTVGARLKYSKAEIAKHIEQYSRKENPVANPAKYLLISFGRDGSNPKVEASGNDYDKLTDLSQRKNESEKNLNRFFEVVDAKDFKEMRKGKNPETDWQKLSAMATLTKDSRANEKQKNDARELLKSRGWTVNMLKVWENKRVKGYTAPRKKNDGASDFKNFEKQRLQELAKMFQGHTTGELKRVIGPNTAPRGSYPLGYLVQMTVKFNGKREKIDFDGDAYLTGDLRNNLWVKGKGSILTGVKRPSGENLLYLGQLVQIDYVTAKKHIENGKTVRFYHPLGEVDKQYPSLYMDSDGFPIIVGGGYDIWTVGIVN